MAEVAHLSARLETKSDEELHGIIVCLVDRFSTITNQANFWTGSKNNSVQNDSVLLLHLRRVSAHRHARLDLSSQAASRLWSRWPWCSSRIGTHAIQLPRNHCLPLKIWRCNTIWLEGCSTSLHLSEEKAFPFPHSKHREFQSPTNPLLMNFTSIVQHLEGWLE